MGAEAQIGLAELRLESRERMAHAPGPFELQEMITDPVILAAAWAYESAMFNNFQVTVHNECITIEKPEIAPRNIRPQKYRLRKNKIIISIKLKRTLGCLLDFWTVFLYFLTAR
jgi:hypothetical protein